VKTAESIERQESRKKDAKSSVFCAHNNTPISTKQPRNGTERLKPFRFQPGQSGNPGGRPKVDLAAEIAKALFDQDAEAIFAAFQKVLRKGSPYAFQVLSDRAFGKMKETIAHEHSRTKVSPTRISKRKSESLRKSSAIGLENLKSFLR
jgi:hypothetical protein